MGFLTMLHGTMVASSGGGNGGGQVLGGSPSDTGDTFIPPTGVYMYINAPGSQAAGKCEFYIDVNSQSPGLTNHDPNANQAPALEVAKRIIGYALNADYNNVQLGVDYAVQNTDEVLALWYYISQPVIVNAWLTSGVTVKLLNTINESEGLAYKIEFSNVLERQSDQPTITNIPGNGVEFDTILRLGKRIVYGHDIDFRQSYPNYNSAVFSDHGTTGTSYEILFGAANAGSGSEMEDYLKGLAAWVTNQDVSNINLDTAYNIDSSVGDLAFIRDDYIVEPSASITIPYPYTNGVDVGQNSSITNFILNTTSSSTIKVVSGPWANNHPIFGGNNYYLFAPDQRLSIEFTNITISQTGTSGFSFENLQSYPTDAGQGRYYWAKSV